MMIKAAALLGLLLKSVVPDDAEWVSIRARGRRSVAFRRTAENSRVGLHQEPSRLQCQPKLYCVVVLLVFLLMSLCVGLYCVVCDSWDILPWCYFEDLLVQKLHLLFWHYFIYPWLPFPVLWYLQWYIICWYEVYFGVRTFVMFCFLHSPWKFTLTMRQN